MKNSKLFCAFLLVATGVGSDAIACSSGTRAQRQAWAVERQKILDQSKKVVGFFHETSSIESLESPSTLKFQDAGSRDSNMEIPYTTVLGEVRSRKGKLLFNVEYTVWHDIGVCRWSVYPSNGEFGTFYLEKSFIGVRNIVHFVDRGKK